ncbi:hypothetical protein PLESTB_001651100 [Pleodorina starrii]|uniref:Uncharacterized protein n=1 Tax=Pleodorina starrii TaxID=330485 RepID=A0A9W6BY15_9CHLO|nr:hypothetical protein PLESTM_000870300 [Pleodorina starrii]GLC60641.1 hypothetical protein PLESTB_001651100 [Pleodorina starrii]GLC68897.1 hypothetical protein PLESTF_000755600 [Pleodorina starrii]
MAAIGIGHYNVTKSYTQHSQHSQLTITRLSRATAKDSEVSKALAASGKKAVGLEAGHQGLIQIVKEKISKCARLRGISYDVKPAHRVADAGLVVNGDGTNSLAINVICPSPASGAALCQHFLEGGPDAQLPVATNEGGTFHVTLSTPPLGLRTMPPPDQRPVKTAVWALISPHACSFTDTTPSKMVARTVERMVMEPLAPSLTARESIERQVDTVYGLAARLLDAEVTHYGGSAQLPAHLEDSRPALDRGRLARLTYADPDIAEAAVKGGTWLVGVPGCMLRIRYLPHLPAGPEHLALRNPLVYALALRPLAKPLQVAPVETIRALAGKIISFSAAGDIRVRGLAGLWSSKARLPAIPAVSTRVSVVSPTGGVSDLSRISEDELAHHLGCQLRPNNQFRLLCDMPRTAGGDLNLSQASSIILPLADSNSLGKLLQCFYNGTKMTHAGSMLTTGSTMWGWGLPEGPEVEEPIRGLTFDLVTEGAPYLKTPASPHLMGAAICEGRPPTSNCSAEFMVDKSRMMPALATGAYRSVTAPGYQAPAPKDFLAPAEAEDALELDDFAAFFPDPMEDVDGARLDGRIRPRDQQASGASPASKNPKKTG